MRALKIKRQAESKLMPRRRRWRGRLLVYEKSVLNLFSNLLLIIHRRHFELAWESVSKMAFKSSGHAKTAATTTVATTLGAAL